MHLGLSTYSFPWAIGIAGFDPPQPLTANELLAYAAQKNIQFVQFGDNYPLHQLSREELKGLKQTADESNIKLEVGTRRLEQANISTYLSLSHLMKAPFLRVVIDDGNYRPIENEIISIINKLLPELKEKNIVLAIENHDRFRATTLRHIIEATDPRWVGICLDTANSLGAGESIREIVNELAPYTINLHIKDFSIKRVAHKMGFTINGCIAGEGMVPIPWLLDQLKKFDRCQTATLELWLHPEPTPEATIQKEKEWVEKSIAYLKTMIT